MKYYLAFIYSLLISFNVFADCKGESFNYVQLKVLSCSASNEFALSKIVKSKYGLDELHSLKISSDYVSIINVEAIADVEIIEWHSKNSLSLFKGAVTPIKKDKSRKLMLVGTPLESCETYHKNKTSLYMVNDQFSCCRDIITNKNETTAQCIIKLPSASKYGTELENIRDIGIKLPKISN